MRICHGPVSLGVLCCMAFTPRFRVASLWLRLGLICQLPLAIAWCVVGLYLLDHARSPEAASLRMWDLAQRKSLIGGVGVGSLLLVVLSPENRQLLRKRRNV